MKITKVVVGDLATNCYILSQNNKCIVIDPGASYNKIQKEISDNEVVGVIITHHHFDHIGALKYFSKGLIFDRNNLEEKAYNIGGFCFKVIYTPGHKEDAITIYFDKEKIMFTGDFIFKGTVGRTDLPGGSYKDMINSLNKISKYSKNIELYPGHGEKTTVSDEFDLISHLC